MNERTTEQTSMVKAVLRVYCDWLNQWMRAEGSEHWYDLPQFLVHDPRRQMYGSVGEVVVIQQYHTFTTFTVSDGDEGGPAQLTAWLDQEDDGAFSVVHLVQEFDTSVQSIYDIDQGFLSGP